MWPVSARFDDAVRTGFTQHVAAEVWRSGVFTGTTLAVTGGTVRVDESSKVRRALTLSSSDIDLAPLTLSDTLSPLTTDLVVKFGVEFTEGDVEWIPLGTFRASIAGRASLSGGLDFTADDYAGVIAASRFANGWTTPAGSLVPDEIARIVNDVLPWVQLVDLTGSRTRTSVTNFPRERWDAVEALAAGIGAEAFFDPLGQLVVRPVPDTTGPVVWAVDSTGAMSSMIDAAVSVDATNLYNAVSVKTSAQGVAPMAVTVYQTTGPARWRQGVMRPRFFASPVVTTVQGLTSAARSILARSVILDATVRPRTVPNPALDAGDVLTVSVPGLNTVTRVLSSFAVSLDDPSASAAMDMVVRSDPDATGALTSE